jgi:hypothetical protein
MNAISPGPRSRIAEPYRIVSLAGRGGIGLLPLIDIPPQTLQCMSSTLLPLPVAKRALTRMPTGWRCTLMTGSVTRNRRRIPMGVEANGLDASRPQAAPILSIDELRSVVFIIRCARVIAFLQRFVPEKYLPPIEDRVPLSVLNRLIHELKKLIPKWKWISSARELPRSAAKLGDELFYAITAMRMSRHEIWRAGYTDCVAVLDEAYSLLYSIGIRMRERKHRSTRQQADVKTR